MKFLSRLFGALLAICLLTPALAMAASKDQAHTPSPTPSALPPVVAVCALGDIGPGVKACSGYFQGNLNSGNSSDIAAQKAALATLGFDWDGNFNTVEKLSSLSGSNVDFATLLRGTSFISLHYGGGNDSPAKVSGGTTGFYRIDAGLGLDKIQLMFKSISNAVLYSTNRETGGGGGGGGGGGEDGTGGVAPFPEPASWVTMIMGFGLVGAVLRRRRSAIGNIRAA